MCREENQLDATERFIVHVTCSTCFGHLYAHHQELETILVLLSYMVAGGRRSGAINHSAASSCFLLYGYTTMQGTNIHVHHIQTSDILCQIHSFD